MRQNGAMLAMSYGLAFKLLLVSPTSASAMPCRGAFLLVADLADGLASRLKAPRYVRPGNVSSSLRREK
jgi:hypothetical protein